MVRFRVRVRVKDRVRFGMLFRVRVQSLYKLNNTKIRAFKPDLYLQFVI